MATESTASEATQDVLHTLFLFDGIEASVRTELLSALPPPEEFRRGDVVYTAATFRRAVGVVLAGELSVLRLSGGHERQQRLSAGSLFGVAALFGNEEYVTEVIAAKQTRVQFIPEEQLLLWFHRDGRVAENYVRFLTDRIRFLNEQLRGCTGGDAEDRLRQYLYAHCDADGKLCLKVSWSTLAGQLGMGRSSLYRAREALMESGQLKKRQQHWYISATAVAE